jgi:hypothetical protein
MTHEVMTELFDSITALTGNAVSDGSATAYCRSAEYSAKLAAAHAVLTWMRIKALAEVVEMGELSDAMMGSEN